MFDFTADEDTSFAILDRFYEHGARMVDTAQGYSVRVPGHIGGESETVIGKWLKSRGVRSEMRIATKTGMFGKPEPSLSYPVSNTEREGRTRRHCPLRPQPDMGDCGVHSIGVRGRRIGPGGTVGVGEIDPIGGAA